MDKVKLVGSKLTEEQLKELNEEFKDVLVAVPDKAKDVVYTIDTGDKKPCQTAMYRVAPKWKEQLQAVIKTLMEAGIVEKAKKSMVITNGAREENGRFCEALCGLRPLSYTPGR